MSEEGSATLGVGAVIELGLGLEAVEVAGVADVLGPLLDEGAEVLVRGDGSAELLEHPTRQTKAATSATAAARLVPSKELTPSSGQSGDDTQRCSERETHADCPVDNSGRTPQNRRSRA